MPSDILGLQLDQPGDGVVPTLSSGPSVRWPTVTDLGKRLVGLATGARYRACRSALLRACSPTGWRPRGMLCSPLRYGMVLPSRRVCAGGHVFRCGGLATLAWLFANNPRGARQAREDRAATLYSVGPWGSRTMKQSFASAAGLRGGGPILTNGSMTMFRLGSPPPRIVSGQPGRTDPPGVPKLYACAPCP